MSFQRQIQNRRPSNDPDATVADASISLRNARLAAMPKRCWAQAFYGQMAESGLPIATLNDIVMEHATLDAATAAAERKIAAGEGHPSLRKSAQADAAARISAAHAMAHQPKRSTKRG